MGSVVFIGEKVCLEGPSQLNLIQMTVGVDVCTAGELKNRRNEEMVVIQWPLGKNSRREHLSRC